MELNQTETVMNAEDAAMQEAEAIRAESLDQHVERTNVKTVIPLAFVTYFAQNPSKYHKGTGTGSLTTESDAAKHPDVRQIQRDFPSMSIVTATRLAWLLWRARQVEFWTMDLSKDRVTKVQGGADIVERGTPKHAWAACLDAAYLGRHSQIHELAMERRKRFYEVRNADAEELETIAKTLKGTDGVVLPEGHVLGGNTAQERAQLQANLNLTAKKAVPPKVRKDRKARKS